MAFPPLQTSRRRLTSSSTTSCSRRHWKHSCWSATSRRCVRARGAGAAGVGAPSRRRRSDPADTPTASCCLFTPQESVLTVEYLPALGPFTPEVRRLRSCAGVRRPRDNSSPTPTALTGGEPPPRLGERRHRRHDRPGGLRLLRRRGAPVECRTGAGRRRAGWPHSRCASKLHTALFP